MASSGEFANQNEDCEAASRENARIAGFIVERLRYHGFGSHRDKRRLRMP